MDKDFEGLRGAFVAIHKGAAKSEFGKRTWVREGGSASRTLEDQGATDPGGGVLFRIKNGARFTTVAEVYAPISGTKIQQGSDVGELDPIEHVTVEMTDSDELECLSVMRNSVLCGDLTGNGGHEREGYVLDPDGIRRMSDTEQILIPSGCSSDRSMELDPEEGDAIMVGVVGSAAPWYLTGWTNDVEVEFMIDTGCQVTILATSVFDKMCDIHPEVKFGLIPCTQ